MKSSVLTASIEKLIFMVSHLINATVVKEICDINLISWNIMLIERIGDIAYDKRKNGRVERKI